MSQPGKPENGCDWHGRAGAILPIKKVGGRSYKDFVFFWVLLQDPGRRSTNLFYKLIRILLFNNEWVIDISQHRHAAPWLGMLSCLRLAQILTQAPLPSEYLSLKNAPRIAALDLFYLTAPFKTKATAVLRSLLQGWSENKQTLRSCHLSPCWLHSWEPAGDWRLRRLLLFWSAGSRIPVTSNPPLSLWQGSQQPRALFGKGLGVLCVYIFTPL